MLPPVSEPRVASAMFAATAAALPPLLPPGT